MASLAQMERELTIEHTRSGLEVARQFGRKSGRKRQMTTEISSRQRVTDYIAQLKERAKIEKVAKRTTWLSETDHQPISTITRK
jgi:DNA invertase Pin-like site-specific DNA recombinase